MKKITSCILYLVSCIFFVNAQQDSSVIAPLNQPVASSQQPAANIQHLNFPSQGNFGFTLNLIGLVNNISLGSIKDYSGNEAIMFRYFIKNDLAFRMGFGINLQNKKISTVDSVFPPVTPLAAQVARDSTYKKTTVFFAPGIEKHFFTGKHLDPYLAGNIEIGKISRAKSRSVITTTDTTGKSLREISSDTTGGFSIGLNLITGFNYFFSDKIAIGAEYGLGFRTVSDGGDWRTTTINTPVSGTSVPKTQVGSNVSTTSGLKVNSTAGITLTYFFSRK